MKGWGEENNLRFEGVLATLGGVAAVEKAKPLHALSFTCCSRAIARSVARLQPVTPYS